VLSDNNVWFVNVGAGLIKFVNQAENVELAHIDNSGVLTVLSQVNAATFNASSNYYYFASNSGIYWSWDGTYLHATHSLVTNGAAVYLSNNATFGIWTDGTYTHIGPNVLSHGYVYLAGSGSIFINWDGTGISHSHQIRGPSVFVSGAIQTQSWASGVGVNQLGDTTAINNRLYVWLSIQGMRTWADLSGNANCFLAPNIGDNRGQGLAWQWATWACVDHAIEYGLRAAPVLNALDVVRAVKGYYYEHMAFSDAGRTPLRDQAGELIITPTYGFRASEVMEYLPELVSCNPQTGVPEAIDLDRMCVVLWEAVKEQATRIDELERRV
jgi:hypothetical protein